MLQATKTGMLFVLRRDDGEPVFPVEERPVPASDIPEEEVVRIGIIPFTHAHTNLGTLRAGEPVNVEGDLIGKYVGRILAARRP